MNNVAEMIKARIGEDVEVEQVSIRKNNDVVRNGFCIKSIGSTCAPNIYYDESMTDEQIVEHVVDVYNDQKANDTTDLSEKAKELFSSAEKIYENVVPALVNRQQNTEYLKNVVHKSFLDMEIIYKVGLRDIGNALAFVVITNDHVENIGLDIDRLHESALRNIKDTGRIMGMIETLLDLGMPVESCFIPKDESIYIISNADRSNGASAVLNPDTMSELHKKLDSNDIIILPSSIHEMIGIPVNSMDEDYLKDMVREVNTMQVPEEEVLSYSVYLHNINDGWRVVA